MLCPRTSYELAEESDDRKGAVRPRWLTLDARVANEEVGGRVGLLAALDVVSTGDLDRTRLVPFAHGPVDESLTVNEIIGMDIGLTHLCTTIDFPYGYVR